MEFVRRIGSRGRDMARLVSDLLNLSRISKQDLSRQETNLRSIVDEAMAEAKSEAGGRDIEWEIGTLSPVECDPGLIKQVFANLFSNAVKYTRPRAKARIEVGETKQDGETAIYVRDNGVGFDMRYADKLFGVFQRLHPPGEFEGTGVGLATAARIVRKHGGSIWANAEENKGATFYFALGSGRPATRFPEHTTTG